MSNQEKFSLQVSNEGLATLSIDHPTEKMNVFSISAFDELDKQLDVIEKESFKALILKSNKPGCFIAGADIKAFSDYPYIAY